MASKTAIGVGRNTKRKKTTIGHAGSTPANGQEKCGGAVVRPTKMPMGVA